MKPPKGRRAPKSEEPTPVLFGASVGGMTVVVAPRPRDPGSDWVPAVRVRGGGLLSERQIASLVDVLRAASMMAWGRKHE